MTLNNKKILIPVRDLEPEKPRNALQDAIDRALRKKTYESKYDNWGFIYDESLEISLIYEYDVEDKPLAICLTPITNDFTFYKDEVVKTINHLYGDEEFSPIEMMKDNYNNIRDVMDFVTNIDHSIYHSLTLMNLDSRQTSKEKTSQEGCYYFKEKDKLNDIWYDQYEELIPFFNQLGFSQQKAIISPIIDYINWEIDRNFIPSLFKDGELYGREFFVEKAHNVVFELNKVQHSAMIDISYYVKL